MTLEQNQPSENSSYLSIEDQLKKEDAGEELTPTVQENLNQPQPSFTPKKSIYATHAPEYLKKGISVIPLRPKSKIPLFNGWQRWASEVIPDELAKSWLVLPSNNNIGLALGKQSNVCCVDIDTDNQTLIDNIIKLLPESTWVRLGQKGCVLAYKHNPSVQTFHLAIVDPENPDSDKGKPILDFLNTGTQVVLPPSIHPDTLKPYVANEDLIDVIDTLPELPSNIYQLLVQAIEASGFELFTSKNKRQLSVNIPKGGRDNELTSKAGVLAIDVLTGNITLKQALDVLDGINENFVEKVNGDDIDIEKHKGNLIKFLFNDMQTRNKVLPLGWDEGLDPKFIAELGLSEEQTEIPYSQITREAKLRIEEADAEGVYDVIEWVINKLSQRQEPDVLREQELLEFLVDRAKQICKSTIRVADLKKSLKDKRRDLNQTILLEGKKLDLNSHTAVARAAIADLSRTTPIRTENKILYKWTGTHWQIYNMEEVKLFLSTRYADLNITKRNSDFEGIFKQMLTLSAKKLNVKGLRYINLKNGLLLQNGKFIEHDLDYGATYTLDYNYAPDKADPNNAPLFFKYLTDAWGHHSDFKDRVEALRESICISCLGIAPKHARSFLLYGQANSGKSVLLKILTSMFPEEAKASIRLENLSDISQLTMLHNKLINVVSELSNSKVIEGSLFKMLVSGEPMTGRYLYNEAFILNTIAAHWVASNHLPKSNDTSLGFIRRWLIFHFDKYLKPEEVDVNLPDKIISQELEAIFAWAFETKDKVMYSNEKLTTPASSDKFTAELHIKLNPVKQFVHHDKQLAFNPSYTIPEHELYSRFRQFQFQTVGSRRIMEMAEFAEVFEPLLISCGITKYTDPNENITCYRGVRIND